MINKSYSNLLLNINLTIEDISIFIVLSGLCSFKVLNVLRNLISTARFSYCNSDYAVVLTCIKRNKCSKNTLHSQLHIAIHNIYAYCIYLHSIDKYIY